MDLGGLRSGSPSLAATQRRHVVRLAEHRQAGAGCESVAPELVFVAAAIGSAIAGNAGASRTEGTAG